MKYTHATRRKQARRFRADRVLASALLSAAALALLPPSAEAAVVNLPTGQTQAVVAWGAASGPVVSYAIYLNRNVSGFNLAGYTSATDRSFTVEASPGDLVRVRVAAVGAGGVQGPLSERSDGLRFDDSRLLTPDAADRATVLVGSHRADVATIEAYDLSGALKGIVRHLESRLPGGVEVGAIGQLRAASCDFLGNGDRDFVFGFGSGGSGYVEIRSSIETGMAHKQWIHVAPGIYAVENGETHPACGDVDADGRDELVVGLGSGGDGRIFVYDDGLNDHALMRQLAVNWPAYADDNGEARPALGDIDGDGFDEIVVGLGTGSGAWIAVFEDAWRGFIGLTTSPLRGWLTVEWQQYAQDYGETHPTVGDVDGDGVDEIVVGFGAGGIGRVLILEDITGGYRPFVGLDGGFATIDFPLYNTMVGAVRPSLIDLDQDGEFEVLASLEPEPLDRLQSAGLVPVLYGASGTFAPATSHALGGALEADAWHMAARGVVIVER